jgi:hypothetical protein
MRSRVRQASEFRDNKREKVTNMKTNKKIFLIAVSLALLIFTFDSCKSDVVNTPPPLGPSTISIILDLSASPNVIFAGLLDRQTAEITASLKRYDGAPLSDRTVFFEVVDSAGDRLDLGYFDGNLAMQTVATDAGGTAQTHYYGPLTDEVTADGYLYIRATVAWEGSQFITDMTPLYVVRDADEIAFKAEAIPDVLYASETRPKSEIRAVLTVGGAPAAGVPVYFVLNTDLGRFADGKRNTMVLTNDQGVASLTYVGPFWVELPPTGGTVNITVQVTQLISEQLQIQIIRLR